MRIVMMILMVLVITGCDTVLKSVDPMSYDRRQMQRKIEAGNAAEEAERAEDRRMTAQVAALANDWSRQTLELCPNGAIADSKWCPEMRSWSIGNAAKSLAGEIVGYQVIADSVFPISKEIGGAALVEECIAATKVDGLVNVRTAYNCVTEGSRERWLALRAKRREEQLRREGGE